MQKKNIIISFIAGFLIGICGTVLTINIVNMHQRSLPGSFQGKLPDTVASLKKTDVLRELQQTTSNLDNSTVLKVAAPEEVVKPGEKASTAPKVTAPGEVVKPGEKTLTAPQGKEAVTESQDEIALDGIKVYIQYARERDKKIAEAFSAELRTKGYASVDVENIKHRHRDIRYFHGEDKKAALLLRKQFNNFIAGSAYAKKVSLKIRYLGKIYPKAQKGSLEMWVFF